MYGKRHAATNRALPPLAAAVAALCVGGCNTLARNNYFLPGGVDQSSAVASQIGAAEHGEGPFPTFAEIPAIPNDVRPLSAWRATISETLAAKYQAEAEIQRNPWTLTDTPESFAEATRAKIPPAEAIPPTDATAEAEAFAASLRGRAKAPPPPH